MSKMYSGAIFLMLLGIHQIAWGTDQIICNSRTFNISFAVGSDGYVPNMALSDKSGRYFSDVIEISDMEADHRHVSIRSRSIDIRVTLGKPDSRNLVVFMKNGKGHVKLDARKETLTCDWVV